MRTEFERELETLLNRHSMEKDSNTPDFILACFMVDCLTNFNKAVRERSRWYSMVSASKQ